MNTATLILRRRHAAVIMFLYDWMGEADRVNGGRYLGEDDYGRILLPSRRVANWWGPTEFDARKPWHWSIWWRSRRDNVLVMVERP